MSTGADTSFFVTGGTLRPDAPCYVERQADMDLTRTLRAAEFCYVLTSRQMGKSSLMVRATARLRADHVNIAAVDLTAIGLNLTPDQWYDGLLLRIGLQLGLENELEAYWQANDRLSSVQRFFAAIRDEILAVRKEPLVLFIDEIDVVRSLPFATDEFFGAILECFNRRSEDDHFNRLTFCLLGVATPAELIRDPRRTPFHIGRRIELTDFTEKEAAGFSARLSLQPRQSQSVLERIFYWTGGHPYLTQRLCREFAEAEGSESSRQSEERVDALCERLFLSARAREQDDNLLFVRERILRSDADLTKLLTCYEQILKGDPVPDDETNDLFNQLRLAGLVRVRDGFLTSRNRIYSRVFDARWIEANLPDAQLEKPDGQRIRIMASCTIGRTSGSDLVLNDPKVSRRHALIQAQKQYEYWLVDLGSSNGTFVNGHRVTQPVYLRGNDQIEVGPFRLIFRQAIAANRMSSDQTSVEKTIFTECPMPPHPGR